MRRLVPLAVVAGMFGAAVAVSVPANAAATLPGCGAVNPGKASCTFKILKGNAIPSGVAATTTWTIKTSSGHLVRSGGKGKTTITFAAGSYVLTATGKGFAGAGKIQG